MATESERERGREREERERERDKIMCNNRLYMYNTLERRHIYSITDTFIIYTDIVSREIPNNKLKVSTCSAGE